MESFRTKTEKTLFECAGSTSLCVKDGTSTCKSKLSQMSVSSFHVPYRVSPFSEKKQRSSNSKTGCAERGYFLTRMTMNEFMNARHEFNDSNVQPCFSVEQRGTVFWPEGKVISKK